MQATQAKTIESEIWGRVLGHESGALSREVARAILRIDFPKGDKQRMHELAAKARKGTLSRDEKEEIDSYGRIGSFISIMKSRARVALRNDGNGPLVETHEA
jgi:hypothetical protein